MPRPTREVKDTLIRKFAFTKAPNRSADHEWFELEIDGAQKVTTKFSHGMRELSDNLLAKIARQLLVKRPYLDEMIDCTKSRDAYYQKLREGPEGPMVNEG